MFLDENTEYRCLHCHQYLVTGLICTHTHTALENYSVFDTTTTASYDNRLCCDICSYRHLKFP